MDRVNPVLAQKLGLGLQPDTAEDAPATPMRLMRRALARAADKAVGLSTSVLGIAQDDLDAETLIETGPDGWVVLGLRNGANAGLTGLFLMDPAMRSALIEMQTIGRLLPPDPEPRGVTRTDAVMCQPFADRLLQELDDVGFGGDDLSLASYDMGALPDLRTAGLVMVQGAYHTWRITVQLGGGEAQGDILIALRPRVVPDALPVDPSPEWNTALRNALSDATADLDAVLCRMALPISTIERFEVGQVLRLAGTTVGSVTLVGPDGEDVSPARLGQVAGKRAVRIQTPSIDLEEAPVAVGEAPILPPDTSPHDEMAPDAAPTVMTDPTQGDLIES